MMDERLEKEAEKVAKTDYPLILDSESEGVRLLRPKCKDCWLDCTWRSYFLELDEEHLCPMLEEQIRVDFAKLPPVTKDNLEYYSAMALSKISGLIAPKDPREWAMFHKCLTEHKKTFHPEVNKSVSLELSQTSDTATYIIKSLLEPNEEIKDREGDLEENTGSED